MAGKSKPKKAKEGKTAPGAKAKTSQSQNQRKANANDSKRPTPFGGGPTNISWYTPGKVISDYWRDSRLHNKQLEIIHSNGPELIALKFTFDVENDLGTGYVKKIVDGDGYLAFRQERKNNHISSQETDSWNALVKKLRSRVGLTVDMVKPPVFGAKARSLVLSFLTPFERSLLDMSQKDWSNVERAKLEVEHAKYGQATLTQRFEQLKAVMATGNLTKPVFSNSEDTPKRVKDVSVALKKDQVVNDLNMSDPPFRGDSKK